MKVLITGASGLLGRALKIECEKVPSWQILGLGFSRLEGGLRKVDLTNSEEVFNVINDFKPDVIIHSAAERRPDVVGNKFNETEALNVTATETISKYGNSNGSFVLYISTDYVFDGKSPPYKPDSQPNPLNKYGMTKLEGEKMAMKSCKKYGILRIPILYGDVQSPEESAVTGLFTQLKDRNKATNICDYQLRYPTNTSDIAVVCRQIVEHYEKNPEFGGIWHWQGNECYTKYGMMKVMSDLFQLPMDHITPMKVPSSSATPRPYHCKFDCSELETLGIGQRTVFEKGIKESLQRFV